MTAVRLAAARLAAESLKILHRARQRADDFSMTDIAVHLTSIALGKPRAQGTRRVANGAKRPTNEKRIRWARWHAISRIACTPETQGMLRAAGAAGFAKSGTQLTRERGAYGQPFSPLGAAHCIHGPES